MPKQLFQYDLLISCPGDISENEISAIENAVNGFNTAYEDIMGIKIRTRHWSKSSYAESGGKPQDLLNKQFVKDCDLTIALFWTRFGTPTDTFGSGTEEEVEIMLENGKQVFVGFSEIPIGPSHLSKTASVDEYNRILAFKEKYRDRGIYFTYSSVDELKKIFYAHLSTHFIIQNKTDKLGDISAPKLSVKSILDNTMQNRITIRNYGESQFLNSPLDEVIKLFKKVSSYAVYDYEREPLGIMKNIYVPEISTSFSPRFTISFT